MADPKYVQLTNYGNFCLRNHQLAAYLPTTNHCKMYFLGRMPYNDKKG